MQFKGGTKPSIARSILPYAGENMEGNNRFEKSGQIFAERYLGNATGFGIEWPMLLMV